MTVAETKKHLQALLRSFTAKSAPYLLVGLAGLGTTTYVTALNA